MARLAIRLFGCLQAILDGEPVTGFESDKARALLAYLVVEAERPHRREKLAGLFWPDRTEQAARANLRRVLANLRRVMGDYQAVPQYFYITRQTIGFNAISDAWSDIVDFATLLQSTPLTNQATNYQLEEAVNLYQGDFLEGFSLPDSPDFEEWVLLNRERFQRLVIEALHRLAEAYEGRAEYQRALRYAWRLLDLDPWREEAHLRVMRLLAYTGQRGAALAQYEVCRRLLTGELGVEPARETAELYEQIKAGELTSLPGCPPFPRPSNLPAPLTPFVGREVELAQIKEWLRDPVCRLLTLVGPGGCGKTRLALEAAAGLISEGPGAFSQGVYFVPLDSLQSAETIVPALAQALNLFFWGEGEPEQQLFNHLRQQHMLLILDSFEHLLDGRHAVVEILRAASAVKILITSRTRLNVKGEHLCPVLGMDLPALGSQEDLTQYSAVQLFLQGARRTQPGFALTECELSDVARICLLLEGMPLHILLAASWMGMLSPAQIVTQIEQSFDFLESDWHDLPRRQRSLRAVFDHSWSLLAAREREVFQGLSVFRGGFTYQAAGQVTGANLRDVKALVDKSLLQRVSTDWYEIHETLRRYAAEKLAQGTEAADAIFDRHCAHYAAATQAWMAHLQGPRQRTALVEMGNAINNVRAAWDWAVERRRVAWLDQIMDGLCYFYEWHGRFQEGKAACRSAAQALKTLDSGDGLRVRARALAWGSVFTEKLGALEMAGHLARQSLALLEDPVLAREDTRSERALALRCVMKEGIHSDLKEARRWGEQSLELYRVLGDQWGLANVLEDLGWAASLAGDYGAAQRCYEESLNLRRALGDQRGIASALGMLGFTLYHQGRFEEAEGMVREGITQRGEMGDWAGVADECFNLGMTLAWLGRYREAQSLLEEARSSYHEVGDQGEIAKSYALLALIKTLLGCYEEASNLAEASLSLSQSSGSRRAIGIACWALGCVALAEEAYSEARGWLREAIVVLEEIGAHDILSAALATLGYAACGQGQLPEARRCLAEALRQTSQTGGFGTLLLPLPAIALVFVERGDIERAIELYTLASRYPLIGNSPWFEDVAGVHLATAAARLSHEVVTAARERGRARDLEATVTELLVELEGDRT